MSNQGWIKIHRRLLDWEWYSDVNVRLLFMHLLLKANYEDSKYKGIPVKRGQAIVGRKETPAEVGITEQQYRTALNKLKSTSEITIKSTNKFSIVTLVNYSVYQNLILENNQQVTSQATNEQPTSNQQVTTYKEEKERKNKERKNTSVIPKQNYADEMINIWNNTCLDLPKATKTVKNRNYKLDKLIGNKEFKDEDGDVLFEDLEDWQVFCKMLHNSDFLSRGWGRAGIDWCIKPANLMKIYEGNYNNKPEGK